MCSALLSNRTTQLMNIGSECSVTFHSQLFKKCHMLLKAAILVLLVDNSITKNTQEEVVQRISLDNHIAFLVYIYFKKGSACEHAGNWLLSWIVHWANTYWDCKRWEEIQGKEKKSRFDSNLYWNFSVSGRNNFVKYPIGCFINLPLMRCLVFEFCSILTCHFLINQWQIALYQHKRRFEFYPLIGPRLWVVRTPVCWEASHTGTVSRQWS